MRNPKGWDYKVILKSRKKAGSIVSIGIAEGHLQYASREIFGSKHSPTQEEKISVLLECALEKFNRGGSIKRWYKEEINDY